MRNEVEEHWDIYHVYSSTPTVPYQRARGHSGSSDLSGIARTVTSRILPNQRKTIAITPNTSKGGTLPHPFS